MEYLYRDGRPRHHEEGAASLEYDPLSGTSAFFVTTIDEFENFGGEEVQEIFRNRHILIPGPAPKDFRFNLQGLANLGSLDAKRTLQGTCHISHHRIHAYHIFF